MQPDADDLMRAMRERIRRNIETDLAREAAEGNAHRQRALPLVRDAVRQAREAGLLDGRVWLIGSYAWGTPTGRSDVDLVAETCVDRLAVASLVGDATAECQGSRRPLWSRENRLSSASVAESLSVVCAERPPCLGVEVTSPIGAE